MPSGGLVAPDSYPVRHPTDPNQKNGRIVNSVRYMKMGGADGPGIWGGKNDWPVQKPTGIKAAHPVAEKI